MITILLRDNKIVFGNGFDDAMDVLKMARDKMVITADDYDDYVDYLSRGWKSVVVDGEIVFELCNHSQ